ncbi:hypothetical protein M6B38_168910 [Iris pallida]|uniref:Uncharacterized protein n=1 Tax=Iris pallida TaxID=29817 RepID=A0AAX6EVR7_IRIPA|nr:hypothetical protein M6B38_168910 [Iris pallida]
MWAPRRQCWNRSDDAILEGSARLSKRKLGLHVIVRMGVRSGYRMHRASPTKICNSGVVVEASGEVAAPEVVARLVVWRGDLPGGRGGDVIELRRSTN